MHAGFGVSLGVSTDVSDEQLAEAMDTYVNPSFMNEQQLPCTREYALDGLGTVRIAEKLIQAVKERHGSQQAMAAT